MLEERYRIDRIMGGMGDGIKETVKRRGQETLPIVVFVSRYGFTAATKESVGREGERE